MTARDLILRVVNKAAQRYRMTGDPVYSHLSNVFDIGASDAAALCTAMSRDPVTGVEK